MQNRISRISDAVSSVPGFVGIAGAGATVLDYANAVYGHFPLVLALIAILVLGEPASALGRRQEVLVRVTPDGGSADLGLHNGAQSGQRRLVCGAKCVVHQPKYDRIRSVDDVVPECNGTTLLLDRSTLSGNVVNGISSGFGGALFAGIGLYGLLPAAAELPFQIVLVGLVAFMLVQRRRPARLPRRRRASH
mgnify:CR=1 FL=1